MNEPKTHECWVYDFGCRAEMVSKSEADKVIADLEESHKMEVEQLLMEIVELKEKLVEQATLRAWAELQLRRHKYKRCLAMAEWCDTKGDWYYSLGEPFIDCVDFYIKWRDKWLKIADKFKEAE